MKSASKIFYMIGFVFNVIAIIFGGLLLAFSIMGLTDHELFLKIVAEVNRGEQLVRDSLILIIILLSIELVLDIIFLVIILRARKNLNEGNGKLSTHVVLLIAGILASNLFYLLGGVFGLVAASSDRVLP